MMKAPFLACAVVSVVLATNVATFVSAQENRTYVPGELIVKYAGSLTDPAPRLVAMDGFSSFFDGAPIDRQTGTRPGYSLDAIHEVIGLISIESEFLDRADLNATEAKTAQDAHYEALARRHANRGLRMDMERIPDRTNIYILKFDPEVDVEELAAEYAADAAVDWAEPNYRYAELFTTCPPALPSCTGYVPDDPYLDTCESHGAAGVADLWDMYITQATEAWCTSNADNIVIAVFDTGIDYTHPDIAPNMWINTDEDINDTDAIEPWPDDVNCGVCEGGAGYRARCDHDAIRFRPATTLLILPVQPWAQPVTL